MADDAKPFQVLFDYSDVPTLKRFALSNARIRCALGPFGCVDGNTKVFTVKGLLRISDLTQPTHVLSWNATKGQFQLSLTGGAFPKKIGNPVRIVTESGELIADEFHRVLVFSGEYLCVSDLKVGDSLALHSQAQSKTISVQKLVGTLDVPHCSQIIVDSLGRYAESARRYGRRLLLEEDSAPTSSPLPGGAQASSRFSFYKDGPLARLLRHIRRSLSGDRAPRMENQSQIKDALAFSVAGSAFLPLPQHKISESDIQERRLPSLEFPSSCGHRHTKNVTGSLSSESHSDSGQDAYDIPPYIVAGTILSIERLPVKKIFWDMQVLETNNYITVDGTIHHNSGKSSACVMEIIRRAHEQIPGPDGIRRSRWVVVRSTYGMLKDTTIKTFHDWFPPKLFGEYRVTDHTYIITKFPGVHLEVLFRALDRPDQVSNLLSLEVTGAWFNEARDIPRTIIEAMDARIGRYPSKRDGGPSWLGMIFDSNPPDEDSYLYKMFEKIRPEGWEIFKQPSGLSSHAENTKHLPKNYYKNLAKGKDEMYIRIYIHGQYGYLVTGKPVFRSFVDNIHVASRILEPQKGLDVIVGFDFGLQPACTIGQITPLGQLRILDELVSDGMGLRQFCMNQLLPLLRLKYFGMNVCGFGDPSGTSRAPTDESTCFEVLQGPEVGLRNVIPAPTNAILPRISAVENFLNKMSVGEPGFLLSPNCHFLRKAMNGAYHYEKDPKSNGEEYKPMPTKNFSSHISDSLQMLCMYISEKEANDKRWNAFSAQIKKRDYRPASSEAGY